VDLDAVDAYNTI